MFTVSIDYSDMLEDYFESCLDSDIDEEYKGMIEEVRERKDKDGHYISDSEVYQELVNMGLVGDVLSTIEEYTNNFDSDTLQLKYL